VRHQNPTEEAVQGVAKQAARKPNPGIYDAALQTLARGLTTWPGEPGLLALQESRAPLKLRGTRAGAGARAGGSHSKLVRRCPQAGRRRWIFDGALRLPRHGQTEYPASAKITASVAGITAARDAWLRQQELETERQRILEQDLNDLRQLERRRPFPPIRHRQQICCGAPAALRNAIRANEQARSQAAAVLAHLSAIENARREFASRNFPSVLQLCSIWLAKYPGHAVFAGLEREAEQRQKVTLIDEAKRRAAAEADLHKRLQMLEDALKEHPGEAGFEDEIRFTRNKLELVASIVGKRLERTSRRAGWRPRWSGGPAWPRSTGIIPAWPRRRRGSTGKIEESSRRRPRPLGPADRGAAWLPPMCPPPPIILRRALAEFPGVPQLAELGPPACGAQGPKGQGGRRRCPKAGRRAKKGDTRRAPHGCGRPSSWIRPTRHCARPW